mmetsp:Transcript_66664/g.206153  ORF Transcript_66664/g.206153 Transcript_66664/m.206153 type:complete len:254 (+) Transcript_66664:142-903(+)
MWACRIGAATPTWPLLVSSADMITSRPSCGKSFIRLVTRGSHSAGAQRRGTSPADATSVPLCSGGMALAAFRPLASSSLHFVGGSTWHWPAASLSSSPLLLSCLSADQPLGGISGQGKVSGSKPGVRSKAMSSPSRSPPPDASSQALKTSTMLRCLPPAATASIVCRRAVVRTPGLSPGPPGRSAVLTADRWHSGRPLRSALARSHTVPECRQSVMKSTRVSGWKSRTSSVATSSSIRKLGLPSGSTKHSCSS